MEILDERSRNIDRQRSLKSRDHDVQTCRSVEAFFDCSDSLGRKRPTKTDTNTNSLTTKIYKFEFGQLGVDKCVRYQFSSFQFQIFSALFLIGASRMKSCIEIIWRPKHGQTTERKLYRVLQTVRKDALLRMCPLQRRAPQVGPRGLGANKEHKQLQQIQSTDYENSKLPRYTDNSGASIAI